jgi:serine/threonine protein kinase
MSSYGGCPIIMKLYQRGSLEQAVRQAGGFGLPLGQALRWAAAGSAQPACVGRSCRALHWLQDILLPAAAAIVKQPRKHANACFGGCRLSAYVLHGLEELHAAGVVVLDLKPANVLLADQGRAVLADFGLARVMQEGRQGWWAE